MYVVFLFQNDCQIVRQPSRKNYNYLEFDTDDGQKQFTD